VIKTSKQLKDLIRNLSSVIVPEDLHQALAATARKRGTEKYLADATAVFDEVEYSPIMEKLWAAYQKKFSYAADLAWSTVMASVRRLYEISQEI
jgi:hypothetical protein